MAKKIEWSKDDWVLFISSSVADLINDGDDSTSVLYDTPTNSIHIIFSDMDKGDSRLPQKFIDLMGRGAK